MNEFMSVYKILHFRYGSQKWWPYSAKNRELEICIGAILTQNTSWINVEKAIRNLVQIGLMDERRIVASNSALETAIRPSGYYNQKAQKMRTFCKYVLDHYDSVLSMKKAGMNKLREELLKLKGIGPETADSILLYAFDKPVFVVDAYTRRVFSRLGLCSDDISYNDLQRLFMDSLPKSAKLYNEYHALIVQHGKDACRKKPLCRKCPIGKLCCKTH